MKKAVPIIVIVVLVAIAGVVLLTHNNSKNNSMSNNSSHTNSTTSSSSSSNSNMVSTDKVSISNFSFSPASITVKKGTTVVWTNHDSVAHTVVETDGKQGPNSQPINNGDTYSFTYDTAGTYAYHCSIHPDMKGTVTVTD